MSVPSHTGFFASLHVCIHICRYICMWWTTSDRGVWHCLGATFRIQSAHLSSAVLARQTQMRSSQIPKGLFARDLPSFMVSSVNMESSFCSCTHDTRAVLPQHWTFTCHFYIRWHDSLLWEVFNIGSILEAWPMVYPSWSTNSISTK